MCLLSSGSTEVDSSPDSVVGGSAKSKVLIVIEKKE